MCIGPKPPKPQKPQPPPQLARTPDVEQIRKNISELNVGQGGGSADTTLLTSMGGDPLNNKLLGKKTLLGALSGMSGKAGA
jgi:hypothetical protein